MFAKFLESTAHIQGLQDGATGPVIEGFASELIRKGYRETTVRNHVRAAEHFIHWSSRKHILMGTWTDSSVDSFVHHLHRCRCQNYHHTDGVALRTSAQLFLTHLQRAGIVPSLAEQTTPEPILLTMFHQWMREQRGTGDVTLCNYKTSLRELLKTVGDDPREFSPESIRRFILGKSQQPLPAAAKTCTTAVRLFLRFLIAEGKCPAGLDSAVPQLAHWRLSSLPRYLQPDDVERVLASCERATPVGKRDLAILLLLARLGLRAGDIVELRISDIDWKEAWIQVSGKGRRQTRLPLTQEIGDAIVAYLRHGRPPSNTDQLFIRGRAPLRPFRSHCAVSGIVARALRRAGVPRPSRGAAHLLRHSAATSMLREGASLQEIGAVLRHRSIETTEIYAKVDVENLRQIAQPWPEVHQC